MSNKILTLELDEDEQFYFGYILGISSEILKKDMRAQKLIEKISTQFK